MSSRLDDLYLVDIIEAAEGVAAMLEPVNQEAFTRSAVTALAAQYHLIVIGEACGKLQDATVAEMPDVPFGQIRGFRNRLVHGYFEVDRDLVWDACTTDVPLLASAAENALKKLFPDTYEKLLSRRKGS